MVPGGDQTLTVLADFITETALHMSTLLTGTQYWSSHRIAT